MHSCNRSYFLNLVLVGIVIGSLLIFTKAICDDDDMLIDAPLHDGHIDYYGLFNSAISPIGILFTLHNDAFAIQQIMFYLERHEKSPPVVSLIP